MSETGVVAELRYEIEKRMEGKKGQLFLVTQNFESGDERIHCVGLLSGEKICLSRGVYSIPTKEYWRTNGGLSQFCHRGPFMFLGFERKKEFCVFIGDQEVFDCGVREGDISKDALCSLAQRLGREVPKSGL